MSNQAPSNQQQLDQQSRRQRQLDQKNLKQKQLDQMQEKKKKIMPIVRFLKKHGLKFKQAKVGNFNAKVEYFRVDEFNKLYQNKKQLIQKDKTLQANMNELPSNIFYLNRAKDQPKLKYPRVVEVANDHGKFAAFKADITQSKKLMMVTIIIAVIMAVLWPLWPYALKYVIWIISLYILTGLLVLIGVRLLIYIIFAILGFSIWIFPNLFGDCTILQSFQPFISLNRWDSGICSLICRLLALTFCCYYGYHIYMDPNFIIEHFGASKEAFEDVHDWGVAKIKGEAGNFSQRALTNLDTILNQTADAEEADAIIINNIQPQQGQNQGQKYAQNQQPTFSDSQNQQTQESTNTQKQTNQANNDRVQF